MKRSVGPRAALAALVFCCLYSFGLCQDPTDIDRGCVYDGGLATNRVLPDLINCSARMDVCQSSCGPMEAYCESPHMTIETCRTLCRGQNLQYYGLQAGSQCHCGGALSDPYELGQSSDSSNCSEPCTGNSNQDCGGDFNMQVYEFQEPTKTPGCFFPASVPNAIVAEVGIGVGENLTFMCEPGFELVGESQLTCMSNRTWSSNVLPKCNYTGVFPVTTTESPPTTTQESTTMTTTIEPPPTTTPKSTTATTTTEPPLTTTRERTTAKTTTTESQTTTIKEAPSTDVPVTTPAKTTPAGSTTKVGPPPPTMAQTGVEDLLPYIIGGAVALALLLVIGLIIVLTCKVRKRAGGTTQEISLKPDDMAPVTLLNTGFTPGDGDPEAATLDVVAASGNHPSTVKNEYASHPGQDQEMSTFRRGQKGPSLDDTTKVEPSSPLLDYPPNPIYESADADPAPRGEAGSGLADYTKLPPENEYMEMGNPTAQRGSADGDSNTAIPDDRSINVDDDNVGRWGSKENLISDDGESIFADPAATAATKL